MKNAPSEIDLLRRIAAAAQWVIETNGDYVVGRDGRHRVGFRSIVAAGCMNKALRELREHYEIFDLFADQKAEANETQAALDPKWQKKIEQAQFQLESSQ